MILYQYPGGDRVGSVSAPCFKVEMALRLVGADYKLENLTTPTQVRKVSRTGRLPVLEIRGERIVDSITILDRLEHDFPDAGLAPDEPRQRVRDRLWEHFATDSIYWCGFYLRWVDPDTREGFFQALFGRAPFMLRFLGRRVLVPRQVRRSRLHGSGGKTPQAIVAELERGMDMVEIGLEGGPFLQGRDRPARGDVALASLFAQAGFRDSLPDMRDRLLARPPLVAFAKGVLDACGMKRTRWLED